LAHGRALALVAVTVAVAVTITVAVAITVAITITITITVTITITITITITVTGIAIAIAITGRGLTRFLVAIRLWRACEQQGEGERPFNPRIHGGEHSGDRASDSAVSDFGRFAAETRGPEHR
jgi:hypothetical protein